MLRRFGGLFLVAAFLLAQASGLAHQVWHAGPLGAHAADTGDHKQPAKKDPLCDFHAALGTVLGALQGVVAHLPYLENSAAGVAAAAIPLPDSPRLTPLSRGPPTLL